jgi:hypothetical protein
VAISRLDQGEERRARREMAIAAVQLPRQLRVLEIGVLVDVRFVHHTYPTYPIDRDNSRGHFAMGRTHCTHEARSTPTDASHQLGASLTSDWLPANDVRPDSEESHEA